MENGKTENELTEYEEKIRDTYTRDEAIEQAKFWDALARDKRRTATSRREYRQEALSFAKAYNLTYGDIFKKVV